MSTMWSSRLMPKSMSAIPFFLTVDEERRVQNTLFDHSAGHLIAGVLDAPFPQIRPLGAHHYPGECRVEFMASVDLIEAVRAALPNLLAEAIARDLPVRVIGDPEQTRAIQIGDLPPIPCAELMCGALLNSDMSKSPTSR